MVIETSRAVAEVARALGVNDGTLGNWVNAAARFHGHEFARLVGEIMPAHG
jgi:transposase-like protein